MKKIIFCLFSLCLLCGCANTQAPPLQQTETPMPISSTRDTYFIDGTLENNVFTATQRVCYINKEETNLDKLYFHLYPNLYSTDISKKDSYFEPMYPDGFSKGSIDVHSVSILGVPLDTKISGSLMEINLPQPLEKGKSIILTFSYTTNLPKGRGRLGYYDNCYNLTSFYPVAVVYDNGWQTDTPSNLGDISFTDIADYRMTLRIPDGYTVATTGSYTQTNENNMNILDIKADSLRELAFVASPDFTVTEEEIDGTTVKSYAFNQSTGNQALNFAKDALTYFNSTFGKYPYPTLSVVASSFYGGGMEYPSLVMLDNSLYNENALADLEWVVAHEVAHQWWYAVVGSNPTTDTFVDESLTEYSTTLYIRNKYDKETADKLINQNVITPYSNYKHLIQNGVIHKNISKYSSVIELSLLAYSRGTMMYNEMESIMGKEKLLSIIKSYYQDNAFTIVNADKWKAHIKANHDYDWDSFFNKWLYNKKT